MTRNPNRAALCAAVSLAAVCAAAPAMAQEAQDAQQASSASPSDVVYVYGRSLETTLPQELAEYGSDLVMLGRDTISRNNYADAHQALQMQVPGLYILPRGPFSYSDVSIQGSRIGDVLWLVDGVRINNRLYPGTLSDTLPANIIERIEVLKGGESLFYGTGAAGGVINIVTRDFSDTLGGEIRGGVDSAFGYNISGMVRGPAGPGNFVAYAGFDESDGIPAFSHTEPSTTMDRRPYEIWNIGGKYGLDVTDDLRVSAQYQHTEGDIANTGPTRIYRSNNERNEEIASLRLDYTPNETAQFFVKAYYHDWDTTYGRIRNDVNNPGQLIYDYSDAYWGYEDYGLNALGKFRLHRGLEYLVGYDFQKYSAEDDVWVIAPMTEEVHAIFGQVRTTEDFIKNGLFAIGVRHNEAGGSATVWNANGKYNFTDQLYVQGMVGTNFLLPSAEQLFLNEPCCEAGNPNLEPEESLNANASIGGNTGQFYWQGTYFWRQIDNIITADYADPAFPNGVFVNGDGQVEVNGFELLGGFALTEEWTTEASYTNTRSREEGAGEQFARIPRQQAKASLNYDNGRFGGGFDTRWVGDTFVSVPGVANRLNYGDYVVADLSLFAYVDSDRRTQISLRVENILDHDYGRPGTDLYDSSRAAGETSCRSATANCFTYLTLGSPQTFRFSIQRTF